ncbi:retropepsin-like aspartic protease family protein [Croceicoccus naphthovorans]|uniref:Uncharacterized protein n=1 Tax=Croceicoccus naphthovorans TaxID=1348774 RepID=A0A0G3XLE0_9SPHN|nr:TIGR02281 family clan AA aspartic protease [Croceicoccus naphthovorans]AKM11233.1 hypothetical protein AB433_16645 [Croceicoccus naphthovorans]MBB3989863.1 aspartyl protease family protein [Croceicoccus naphthovorans]
MKIGGILALGAVACVVGMMMPSDQVPEEQAPAMTAEAANVPVVAAAQEASSIDYLTGEMVLQAQADGHFYATPSINMVPVDALIDTGASVVALTGSDATAIGLQWSDSDVRVIGQGASGEVRGVPVRLDKVELGSFELHDVDAVIIPEGLGITLLGQSVLSRIPNVAISEGQMNLSDY